MHKLFYFIRWFTINASDYRLITNFHAFKFYKVEILKKFISCTFGARNGFSVYESLSKIFILRRLPMRNNFQRDIISS